MVVFLNINIGFDPSRETQTGSMEAIVTGSQITARSRCWTPSCKVRKQPDYFPGSEVLFLREVHCSSAVIL
jgi:hypothetical protein